MPLAHATVIDRFVQGRRGTGANMSTNGHELLDYGWYWLATRLGPEEFKVNRNPYPSPSSKTHFRQMLWRLPGAPAQFVDDYNAVIWRCGGELQPELAEVGSIDNYTFHLRISPWDSECDSVVVRPDEGWRPGYRAHREMLYLVRRRDLRAALHFYKRSLAASKAVQTTKSRLKELQPAAEAATRVVFNLPPGDYGPLKVDGELTNTWYGQVRKICLGDDTYRLGQSGFLKGDYYSWWGNGDDLPSVQLSRRRRLVQAVQRIAPEDVVLASL